MEDKLHNFFSDNNFDVFEPHVGHKERFERKLKQGKSSSRLPWKWMSVAACFVLFFGFWLGSNQQEKQLDLADISPKMEEVQNYFVNTINQEIKELEKNRNLDTETLIEEALEELEELEESYQNFVKELNKTGSEKQIIKAMIDNYQQRLKILENVLQQINQVKNTQINYDEYII